MQVVGSVVYQGKKVEIVGNPKQWEDFKMVGGKFVINQRLLSDFKLVEEAYNKFCDLEIRKIIDRQIGKLRTKEIDIDLNYTDGTKKKTKVSVNSYLKLCGYESKIDYKIGVYEKEWGINELKAGAKNFTLYFNLNLIKYDSGSHIEYVVAHELAHVFFRDHGVEFNDALFKLYPRKHESEYFFNMRLPAIFGSQGDQGLFYFVIFSLLAIAIGVWFWQIISGWFQGVFSPGGGQQGKFY
jgi:hypothetical protein